MPLTDSRVGPGTFKLVATDYSFQVANCRLEPEVDEEDGTPTLATPAPVPLATVAWSVMGSVISDFALTTGGFVNYCFDNALAVVAWEFIPNTNYGGATKLKYSGTCQIRPVVIGGDAAVQTTVDFEFPVVGTPVRVNPAALMADEQDAKASKK